MKHIIEGFSKYYITDTLEIYSSKLNNKLSIRVARGGYPSVSLTNDNRKRTTQYVHVLVAKTFVFNPDPERLTMVNHKDGNKLNYLPSNLEWVTCSENILHAYKTGLHIKAKSVDSPNTILNEKEVRNICKLLQDGLRPKDVAQILLVSLFTVKNIRKKNCFKDIVKEYRFEDRRWETLSEDTVRWVCEKLVEGLRPKEIENLSTNPLLNYQRILSIKARKSFVYISKEYKF